MKILLLASTLLLSLNVFALDLKGLVEKVQKDKKMQEQIKDGAKKAYDYFQGGENKQKTETPKEEAPSASSQNKIPKP